MVVAFSCVVVTLLMVTSLRGRILELRPQAKAACLVGLAPLAFSAPLLLIVSGYRWKCRAQRILPSWLWFCASRSPRPLKDDLTLFGAGGRNLWRCNGDLPVDYKTKMRGIEYEHDRTHLAHAVNVTPYYMYQAGALGRILSEQDAASLRLARVAHPVGTRVEVPTCPVMALPHLLRTSR